MARSQVRPLNLFADYMAGKDAAQQERVNQQQNTMRDQQLERGQRLNALSQNPQASPEDYIRAGDVQTGAALSGYQQKADAGKQQALGQLAVLAQKALAIQDPAQRKVFLSSPEISQAYGPAFQAIGADHGKGIAELQQLPDGELQQRLSQVAQFAPAMDSGDAPSNVREWQYYNKLSPQDQNAYREMKRAQNPFTPAEFGGSRGSFNKNTGEFAPMSTLDQEAGAEGTIAGAKAGATERAKTTVEAQFDLPRVEQNAKESIGVIDKLLTSKGLPYITGLYSKAPIVPGTEQAAANALAEQIQGQTFLQAFQSLKGGGAITETEGQKATAAIGRLNRAQSTKDYQEALKELKGIATAGLLRAKKKASAGSAGSGKESDPLGIR